MIHESMFVKRGEEKPGFAYIDIPRSATPYLPGGVRHTPWMYCMRCPIRGNVVVIPFGGEDRHDAKGICVSPDEDGGVVVSLGKERVALSCEHYQRLLQEGGVRWDYTNRWFEFGI